MEVPPQPNRSMGYPVSTVVHPKIEQASESLTYLFPPFRIHAILSFILIRPSLRHLLLPLLNVNKRRQYLLSWLLSFSFLSLYPYLLLSWSLSFLWFSLVLPYCPLRYRFHQIQLHGRFLGCIVVPRVVGPTLGSIVVNSLGAHGYSCSNWF